MLFLVDNEYIYLSLHTFFCVDRYSTTTFIEQNETIRNTHLYHEDDTNVDIEECFPCPRQSNVILYSISSLSLI